MLMEWSCPPLSLTHNQCKDEIVCPTCSIRAESLGLDSSMKQQMCLRKPFSDHQLLFQLISSKHYIGATIVVVRFYLSAELT